MSQYRLRQNGELPLAIGAFDTEILLHGDWIAVVQDKINVPHSYFITAEESCGDKISTDMPVTMPHWSISPTRKSNAEAVIHQKYKILRSHLPHVGFKT